MARGKAFVVSQLQVVLLQQRLVRLPSTREAKALARELLDYEIRVSDSAAMQAGAFKTGQHDDLVSALGLTVLDDPRRAATRISGQVLGAANAGLRRTTHFPISDAMKSPHSRSVAVDRDGWERR